VPPLRGSDRGPDGHEEVLLLGQSKGDAAREPRGGTGDQPELVADVVQPVDVRDQVDVRTSSPTYPVSVRLVASPMTSGISR
jgi:hypothetical protein